MLTLIIGGFCGLGTNRSHLNLPFLFVFHIFLQCWSRFERSSGHVTQRDGHSDLNLLRSYLRVHVNVRRAAAVILFKKKQRFLL